MMHTLVRRFELYVWSQKPKVIALCLSRTVAVQVVQVVTPPKIIVIQV